MLNKIKARLSGATLPSGLNNSKVLISAAAVLLTGAIIVSLWRSNQGYVALYGANENLPVSQVVEVLGGEGIDYRISPDNGQILVPDSQLSRARMALAAKGISAVLPEGYELMDKEEMLGSSQFVQNVRYKRSLEGELAKSIMGLEPVENARVHLGLSEASSFVMNNKPESSASVMVQLRYGKTLDGQQVGAIVQLVAGSVPGMKVGSVRVVDQTGNLLSESFQNGNTNLAGIRQGNEIVQRLKADTEKNISGLLTSLVGANNFRISVAPQVDISSVEETQERLGKDARVSDESISQENTTNELAMGIPGSLSNRPVNQRPEAAAAAAAGENPQAAAPATSDPRSLSSRSQEQRKYAYDRDIRHVRHPGYKVEKMRVAVALNQTAPALDNIAPEQLASLTRLIEDAAGIDKERGDSLTLDVMAFTVPDKIDFPEMKWWQDPSIHAWGKSGGIGLLALLTLLFGVRPLAQRFGRRDPITIDSVAEEPGQLSLTENEQIASDEVIVAGLPKSTFLSEEELPPQSSGLETKVEFLQVLAQNETERVAEVLKQWINNNERNNSTQE